VTLTAGETIVIVVDGYSSASGSHRLQITGSATATPTTTPTPTATPTIAEGDGQFLAFPLSTALYPFGPYTAGKITSVLDHHMSTPYSEHDGTVLSFTGELFRSTGSYPIQAPLACYPKEGGFAWSSLLTNLYVGTGTGKSPPENCARGVALNYEAHPGYDYRADPNTPVHAAAGGRVVDQNDGCVPKGLSQGCRAWGAVGIDHGNGYISQYLHLEHIYVSPGAQVSRGDLIGLSGRRSPCDCLGPHLHFEVLKLRAGSQNSYSPQSYATVDPYGFNTLSGQTDYMTVFNNNEGNECLWIGGCRYE
jgi:murein DD-endopeptidase MepM/ murein hydrolase activator NlpD